MSAPLVKVCGIRDAATAAAIAPLPVDYIGFVFAPSKRRVSAAEAESLIASMRAHGGRQRFAGVFVNPSPEELERVLQLAPLDVIQLHGSEPPELLHACRRRLPGVQLWKAIGVSGETDHGERSVAGRLSAYEGVIDALLLDAYDPLVGGGTGRTFRWDVIPVYQAWADRQQMPLFIAGGLHAGNVADLLEQYAVGGVDVSSGVETDGVKDMEKIRTFLKRVKR